MVETVAWLGRRLEALLPPTGWRTRFAPAPTGYLHLGHLVNAIHVWGIARAYGGRVLLRIEDHDRTRCRRAYEQALLEDLAWLGLEADIGTTSSFGMHPHPLPHPQRQSDQDARYAEALARLDARGLSYPCTCTRREIALLSAHSPGDELRYPGTCRDAAESSTATLARRIRIANDEETFDDLRLGTVTQRPAHQCGDVLARDRHGNWTYQFAVTVDDAVQQIDIVIRGEDLLASTGRQRQLARLLGRRQLPGTLHHGLLRRPDGTKLSKGNGDSALRERRSRGATPQALFGEAAWLAGLQSSAHPLSVDALPGLFR